MLRFKLLDCSRCLACLDMRYNISVRNSLCQGNYLPNSKYDLSKTGKTLPKVARQKEQGYRRYKDLSQ